MKTFTLGTLAVVLAFAGAAFAFPTLQGPTGGLQVPTASVQEGIAIAVDRSESEFAKIPNLRLEAGIIPNLEAGIGYEKFEMTDGTATGSLSTFQINAKYALPIELLGAKLAAGTTYNQTDFDNLAIDDVVLDKLTDWSLYLSGTYPLQENLKLTLSAIYDDAKLKGSGDNELKAKKLVPAIAIEQQFENGSAIGAEYFVNVSPLSSLAFNKVAAIDGSDNSLDFGNIYARFPLNSAVMARIAFNGINQNTGFTAGLAYTFGGGE